MVLHSEREWLLMAVSGLSYQRVFVELNVRFGEKRTFVVAEVSVDVIRRFSRKPANHRQSAATVVCPRSRYGPERPALLARPGNSLRRQCRPDDFHSHT